MGSKGRVLPPPHLRRPPLGPAMVHPDPYAHGVLHLPPGAFPPFDMMLPAEVMEQKLAAQHVEMQRLATENHRLTATHGTSREELAGDQHELQILHAHIGAVKSKREQQRSLQDKVAKMKTDIQAAQPVKLELQQARAETQKLMVVRQEQFSKVQQLSKDLHWAHIDVHQIPVLMSELESLRQEYQHCRYFMDPRVTELVDPNDPLGHLKRRGWANIPDAPLNPDDRVPVLFDATGNPIGENGQQLKSSIGRLVKSSIPININDWTQVEEDEKFKIWKTICNRYKVDDTWKSKCYKIANKAWKEYKTSRLARNYVFPYLEPLDEVELYKIPEGHPWITPQVWKDFVDYRRTDEFQIIREEHQNIQMHNILPNRTGRSSNPEVRYRMEAELGRSVTRTELYIKTKTPKMKKSRSMTKRGKEQLNKLKAVQEQISRGEIIEEPGRDALYHAFGREHPGRVRGGSQYDGYMEYFNIPKQKPQTVSKEKYTKIEEKFNSFKATVLSEIATLKKHQSQQMSAMTSFYNQGMPYWPIMQPSMLGMPPSMTGRSPSMTGRPPSMTGRPPSIEEELNSFKASILSEIATIKEFQSQHMSGMTSFYNQGMPYWPSMQPSMPGMPPSMPGRPPSMPGMPPSIPGMPPSIPGMPPSIPGMPPSIPGMPPSIPELLNATHLRDTNQVSRAKSV